MRTQQKVIHRVLLSTVLLVGSTIIVLRMVTHQPNSEAIVYTQSTSRVNVVETSYGIKFIPVETTQNLAVIFYQGALVEEKSYSIWARDLAEKGYPVYLLNTPLNLAILSANQAEYVLQQENIQQFIIGGHSLGGVVAARFAVEKQPKELKGIFFLASYPDQRGNLANKKIPVLSLMGTEDKILDREQYERSKWFLPVEYTHYISIKGGNHSGFGSYGQQRNDGKAKLTTLEQQQEFIRLLNTWIEKNIMVLKNTS